MLKSVKVRKAAKQTKGPSQQKTCQRRPKAANGCQGRKEKKKQKGQHGKSVILRKKGQSGEKVKIVCSTTCWLKICP